MTKQAYGLAVDSRDLQSILTELLGVYEKGRQVLPGDKPGIKEMIGANPESTRAMMDILTGVIHECTARAGEQIDESLANGHRDSIRDSLEKEFKQIKKAAAMRTGTSNAAPRIAYTRTFVDRVPGADMISNTIIFYHYDDELGVNPPPL